MRTASRSSSAKAPRPEPSTSAMRGRSEVRARMNCAASSAWGSFDFGGSPRRPASAQDESTKDAALLPNLFQILLHFERSHATSSCGGHRLAIMTVGHVTTDEDARRARAHEPFGDEIALSVAPKLVVHE